MLNKLSDLERQVKVANDSVTKYTDLLKGDQVKKVVQRLKCTDQLNKSLDRHSLHTAKHKEYSAKCDAKIEELNACKNLANKRKAILDGIPKPPIIRIEINHITKDSDYDKDLL